MANNYEKLREEFRGLVEKLVTATVKEKFVKQTGVKVKAKKEGASLIASRVDYSASRDDYKEQRSLILEQMLAELKGAKKGKVNQSMLIEAAKRVKANVQEEVASL